MNKKRYIIPIFVPHLGCPNDCIFCNQKKITNRAQSVNRDEIFDIIESHLSYFPKDAQNKEIAFFGGSFTAIERDLMIEYLEIAYSYKKRKIIDHIRLSTRPDAISSKILDILKFYEVDIIELGVQSMDDEVLLVNNRGHNSQSVVDASLLIKSYGFILGHQIMPGLYMDSFEKTLESARKLIGLKPDIVRIYPTLIIKNTALESLYKLGLYKPLTIDEAVDISSKLLKLFEAEGIKVIRIGLQASENINDNADVIAGPFHPAFRQLVEQKTYFDRQFQIIKENNLTGAMELVFHLDKRKISYAVGNKSANKNRLMEIFNIKNIKYIPEDRGIFYLVADSKIIDIGVL